MSISHVSDVYLEEETPALGKERNLEDLLSMLSEELDALGIEPVTMNVSNESPLQALVDVSMKLVDASWKLIHKHRLQMKKYDQLNDVCSKISNDNYNLKNRIEASREAMEKQNRTLSQTLERERRSKEEIRKLTCEHKCLKEETVKLGKLLRSKEDQHEHELRRVARTREKYRDQLEKMMGCETKGERKVRMGRDEGRSTGYDETVLRLEENNRTMIEEIGRLREALALCSTSANSLVDSRIDQPFGSI
ncbi:uncharacterized protein LOC122405561 isoform X1 [Colletes gigas]|uniref:uncharacterized protein LOC122405561 isoform X1 n=1 Tax=Colletes gigas TaxID=935657 RepID=UPI001C9AC707|nr:uncharacterized protein LOC122405561 isoform X1 [Colletes gigas]XP_043266365.1 uncharacterized protein LOC122405561 isoform X1 [Colletes gigas]